MDKIDRAAGLQQKFNESAIAERRPPASVLRPNWECGRCNKSNDRPEYAICSSCFQALQPA